MTIEDLFEHHSSKKQKRFYMFLAALIIIPIIILSITVIQSKTHLVDQLVEFNKKRETAFAEIRPALLNYKEQHGTFPESLDKLIPDYIAEVPKILLLEKAPNQEYDTLDLSVQYLTDGKEALFRYRRGLIHTPVISYDIATGTHGEENNN